VAVGHLDQDSRTRRFAIKVSCSRSVIHGFDSVIRDRARSRRTQLAKRRPCRWRADQQAFLTYMNTPRGANPWRIWTRRPAQALAYVPTTRQAREQPPELFLAFRVDLRDLARRRLAHRWKP
jgi:hypothetical protein